ncbi:MAG TPA: hypothetical protein PLD20_21120 [Blastocatellia bacterium]|nr:hypothetical protein [Blastocatellia bacterium]HMV83738.1 hypothetical protein [Blastocatellia bacterium]HMX26718.1 hypothetical protein [Blastocatellia bacterium]HMY73218.1 hypothetical protein [Blastocatellia bacterium]HMZ20452.1 hypothetical protein [Blastocatellia bacterium]
MSFPVLVEASNGHFTASLAGMPTLSVVEATREKAIAALRTILQKRLEQGELVSLEVEKLGVSDLAGKFADDPTLREICEQAYQLRDAELEP